MRAPLSWLRDFTPVAEHARGARRGRSRSSAWWSRAYRQSSRSWTGIVVARVLATRPHPSADRIQLVDVDAGDGEALQVCCGAFNMKAGDLVPLATLGTVMPSGLEIGRRKMRGEWSNGMLCSAPEIGSGAGGTGAGDPRAACRCSGPRHTVARSARLAGGRCLRPGDKPQPARLLLHRRRGP